MRLLVLAILMGGLGHLIAQPKHCSKLVQHGDTTICQRINDEEQLEKELFYLQGKRIFTRVWTYYWGGAYNVVQKTGKWPFEKMDGMNVWYYPGGKVQYATVYRNGKIIGPTTSYYPSGVVESMTVRIVRNGKADGLVNDYYRNGNICAKRIFRNGRLQTIVAYRDEDGTDLPIGTFKDGNGDWVIQLHGKPIMVKTYKNGLVRKTKILKDPIEH